MVNMRLGETVNIKGEAYECVCIGRDMVSLKKKEVIIKEKLKPIDTEEVNLSILKTITLEDLSNFINHCKTKGGFVSKRISYYIATQYMGYPNSALVEFWGIHRHHLANVVREVRVSSTLMNKADITVLALCRWKKKENLKKLVIDI